jgi:hypothetical protein
MIDPWLLPMNVMDTMFDIAVVPVGDGFRKAGKRAQRDKQQRAAAFVLFSPRCGSWRHYFLGCSGVLCLLPLLCAAALMSFIGSSAGRICCTRAQPGCMQEIS